MKKPNNTRLIDVATAAGVSITLASHVLNKSTGKNIRVGEDTAEKIRNIAGKLGYAPNYAAKALATNRIRCIGYVMSSSFENPWNNQYYSRYLSGVESECRKRGYGLMIGLCSMDTAEGFVMPEHVSQKRVDGLIVIGGIAPELWDVYKSYNIPTVLLDYTPDSDNPPYPYVELSERWEFRGLEYAFSMGHHRLGICLSAYFSNCDFIFSKVSAKIKKFQKAHNCHVHAFRPPSPYSNWEYGLGGYLHKQWKAIPSEKRPSIILGGNSLI
jgi:LacI family transcriptional regulator